MRELTVDEIKLVNGGKLPTGMAMASLSGYSGALILCRLPVLDRPPVDVI